ncbi:hypothetical protein MMOR_39490 [Mycolicibacterium moriokaense]|uniref:DUF1772 domain-containing protein n=2 Tax=Mycolicibacterium moriokaense TaxID=39691 RepID=A0AAD1HCS3_9MYCO|nr:hypothetical protein MMOR_39490 [Mycolicibacterium moriokaense]
MAIPRMISPLPILALLLTRDGTRVSVANAYVGRVYDMTLDLIARAAALIAVLGTAVVYGTDMFCAIVLRPALASVDDATLVEVTGNVHRYGDRRMPVPGVLGVVAAAATVVLAAVAAQWPQAIAAAVALVLLLVWIVLYTRVSAPVNRELTAAVDAGRSIPNGRVLQEKWDRIIGVRAVLQGLAVTVLCVALTI